MRLEYFLLRIGIDVFQRCHLPDPLIEARIALEKGSHIGEFLGLRRHHRDKPRTVGLGDVGARRGRAFGLRQSGCFITLRFRAGRGRVASAEAPNCGLASLFRRSVLRGNGKGASLLNGYRGVASQPRT